MRRFRSFFKKKISKKNFSKKFSNFFLFPVESGKVIFQSYRACKAHFGCLESVFKAFHEYILGIFRKLWAFWALDIAPTLDVPVLLFFSVDNLTLSGPLFLQFVHLSYLFIFHICSSATKPESVGSILALNHKFFNASKSTDETKGSPLWFFFGTMRLFSKIFEFYQRVPPCIFLMFSVCRKRLMSLNDLFLSFSALCDFFTKYFFSKKIFSKYFQYLFLEYFWA